MGTLWCKFVYCSVTVLVVRHSKISQKILIAINVLDLRPEKMQEPGGCINQRKILEFIELSFMALKAQCKNPKQTKSIVETIT